LCYLLAVLGLIAPQWRCGGQPVDLVCVVVRAVARGEISGPSGPVADATVEVAAFDSHRQRVSRTQTVSDSNGRYATRLEDGGPPFLADITIAVTPPAGSRLRGDVVDGLRLFFRCIEASPDTLVANISLY